MIDTPRPDTTSGKEFVAETNGMQGHDLCDTQCMAVFSGFSENFSFCEVSSFFVMAHRNEWVERWNVACRNN